MDGHSLEVFGSVRGRLEDGLGEGPLDDGGLPGGVGPLVGQPDGIPLQNGLL